VLGLVWFGAMADANVSAPPDREHANGTEGGEYLGRWWDPGYAAVLAGLACVP
jgi:hypothetical protein